MAAPPQYLASMIVPPEQGERWYASTKGGRARRARRFKRFLGLLGFLGLTRLWREGGGGRFAAVFKKGGAAGAAGWGRLTAAGCVERGDGPLARGWWIALRAMLMKSALREYLPYASVTLGLAVKLATSGGFPPFGAYGTTFPPAKAGAQQPTGNHSPHKHLKA